VVSCGFYICADIDCSVCVSNVKHIQCFKVFSQREQCMCQRETILVLLHLTAGLLPTPPAHPRSIYLEDELQFMFVCKKRKCSYRQSVPQIQSRKTSLRCVCGEKCVYHIDKQIYSCPNLTAGVVYVFMNLIHLHICIQKYVLRKQRIFLGCV
jgi:hypothetical protein